MSKEVVLLFRCSEYRSPEVVFIGGIHLQVKLITKISLGIAGIVLVFSSALGYIFMKTSAINDNQEMVKMYAQHSHETEMLKQHVLQQTSTVANYLISGDVQYQKAFEEHSQASEKIAQELLGMSSGKNKEQVQKIQALDQEYDELVHNKIIPLFNEGKKDAATVILMKEAYPLAEEMNQVAEAYSEDMQRQLDDQVKHTLEATAATRQSAIFYGSLALLLAIGVTLFIGQKLKAGFNSLLTGTKAVAAGDFSQEVPITSQDELGEMGQGLNTMIAGVREMIAGIKSNAATLASSSGEMNRTIATVSQSVEEIAQTATNLSVATNQGADNSRLATETALQINQNAVEGGQSVDTVIQKMSSIDTTVTGSATVINSLKEQATNIHRMLEVIRTIADQTNLLALNAAIEAARAGENGRGFAVVAEEVRKLAEESTGAVKDIQHIIQEVNAGADDSVQAMQNVTRQVKDGVINVQDTGEKMQDIIRQIERSTEAISEIAASYQETSAGIETVVSNVEETAASFQMLNATADQLNQMAEELNQLVDKFQV